MIKIYILNTEHLDEHMIDSLPFGESEKHRLTAMGSSKHKMESLGGLVALKRLFKKAGAPYTEICRNSRGKPYFSGDAPLPFGISHSNGIAAAALGDAECADIGFDLEIVRDGIDTDAIAKRYFSEKELGQLAKSDTPSDLFFSIWTAKEAYAKLDGRGLAAVISENNEQTYENAYLYRLTADIGGQRAVLSVVCRSEGQAVQIFTDTEENK